MLETARSHPINSTTYLFGVDESYLKILGTEVEDSEEEEVIDFDKQST
jgi:hypothetical protein